MIFNPSIKLQWNLSKLVGAGVEYYGTTGSINRLAPGAEQSHIIYPSLDFDFSGNWEFNIGYGVRVAGTGDHDIVNNYWPAISILKGVTHIRLSLGSAA